ncbi:unnamed protein product [Somion occarium]|uniref:HTH CENPB-type domain-containing protein n=1 Tax=Somion occarium TaxID=3059160 RepID=A0ABP1E1J8_9APHY
MPQDMSWTSYNSYTRTVPSNSPEEQPLYPSMNRIPGPYSLPWMASTDYMGRTQPQSQCSFQSDAPQFAHNGLDSSGTPLTRRRAREEDSAALSGSPATYGNTDSSQVDGHLNYPSNPAPADSPQEMAHASNGAESAALHTNSHATREELTLLPAPPHPQLSPYSFSPTHARAASDSSTSTTTSASSGSSSHPPRSASPATSVVSAHTVSSTVSASRGRNDVSSETSPATVRKHKKQRLYNVDRKRICEYYAKNPAAKQEDIARQFKVERSTISKILKHKEKWLHVPTDTPILIARDKPTKFPMLDRFMKDWLRECTHNKIILTDAMIRQKALEFADQWGWSKDKFKASSGWVENFKHRWGIRKGMWLNYTASNAEPNLSERDRANGVGYTHALRDNQDGVDDNEEYVQPDVGLPLDTPEGPGGDGYAGSDHEGDAANGMGLGAGWAASGSQMPVVRSMGDPVDIQNDLRLPEQDLRYSRPVPGSVYLDSSRNRDMSFALDRSMRPPLYPHAVESVLAVRGACEGLKKVLNFINTNDGHGLLSPDQQALLWDVDNALKKAQQDMEQRQPQRSQFSYP